MVLYLFALFACADDIEKTACEILDGDVHVLTASSESGLEDGLAQFHVASHLHTVELSEPGWIWAQAAGENVTIFTNAAIAQILQDGNEVDASPGDANSQCSEELDKSHDLTLKEGIWEFQLDGVGQFSWVVVPNEIDGHDHDSHEH